MDLIRVHQEEAALGRGSAAPMIMQEILSHAKRSPATKSIAITYLREVRRNGREAVKARARGYQLRGPPKVPAKAQVDMDVVPQGGLNEEGLDEEALDDVQEPEGPALVNPQEAQALSEKEDKEERLAGAVDAITRTLATEAPKREKVEWVQSHAGALGEHFGLTRMAWVAEDGRTETDPMQAADPLLLVEINPKALIQTSTGKRVLNPGDTSHSTEHTQKVTFTSKTLHGSKVGTEMVAEKLGPNHPQGGGPSASALKTVMSYLTTNPAQKGSIRYIKGHLLNDNLGGPGEEENLYPITGQANSDHEKQVESVVKEWVNEKGYWVYYKVQVVDQGSDVTAGVKPTQDALMANYVDADFVCTAYALDSAGNKSKRILEKTIRSRHGATPAPVVGTTLTQGTNDAYKDPTFVKSKVEESSAKGDGSEPASFSDPVLTEAETVKTWLKTNVPSKAYHTKAIQALLPGTNTTQADMVLGELGVSQMVGDKESVQLANWNRNMNPMVKKEDEILVSLTSFLAQAASLNGGRGGSRLPKAIQDSVAVTKTAVP